MRITDAYPKVMKHPAERTPPIMRGRAGFHKAAPGAFPAVTVYNEDQEAEYRARGYRNMGEGPSSFVHQEYPKWVNGLIARNEQEEAKILGKATPGSEQPVEVKVKAKPEPEGIKPVEPSSGFNEALLLDSVRALRSEGKNWSLVCKALIASGIRTQGGFTWNSANLARWCKRKGIE
jgi:hypothetical protein